MTSGNPFLDPELVRGSLYDNSDRLHQRSGSLRNARISGRPATTVIAELVDDWRPDRGVRTSDVHPAAGTQPSRLHIADIGCGRGSSTLTLADTFPQAEVVAVDLSPALLATTRQRLGRSGRTASVLCADFHHLPLKTGSCDVIVAAFCLYHSSDPAAVITEIARCLADDGVAVLATKSVDSYHQLDLLVARSGLDTAAASRTSLYASAHSANLPELTTAALDVLHVVHDQHVFGFDTLSVLANYLITTPKYQLPAGIDDATKLTAALRERLPEHPTILTSTVSYLVGGKPQARRRSRSR